MRPFRFGVQATDATSAKEWRDVARRVEELGYSTLFVADHYLGPGPAAGDTLAEPQQLAPVAAMAAAASWTSTLRVGCRVFCIDYHVPAVLAKEAATLDLLSGGRLDFGIGAGWHANEYRAMGLNFDDAPRRVTKLEEVVALLKAHFSGEQMDVEGKFVRAAGYSGLPIPVQRPHPPIMIGGSKKRVLSFAAREADIVSIATVPWAHPDPMAEAGSRLACVRQAAGGRFDRLDIESSPSCTVVTDDIEGTLERVAPGLRHADPRILRQHPNVLVGPVGHLADQLQERREATGVNFVTVWQEQFEEFAPVVAHLNGK
jgi:probable F420-dependent oxidoreductase